MLKRIHQLKAQSFIEYVFLIAIVITAFFIFQRYIARAINGRWKDSSDSFGYGRLYDPQNTIECAINPYFSNSWYDVACYEQNCTDACVTGFLNVANCTSCISLSNCEIGICQP